MARARPKRQSARKRDRVSASTAAARIATGRPSWMRPLTLGAWAVVTIALLIAVGMAMEHQITWYLAVDQFGYVTFANDLLKGSVFHHWDPIDALGPMLRPRTDMLAQTYIWDQGHIYSRYAPGFPMLLAGWLLLFGRDWAHYLNPSLFLLMLALVIVMQWTVARSVWRGTVAAALIFLCPTYVHLWGLTLTRDMSAHVAGMLAITLLLVRYRPLSIRRVAAAGFCIGFAGSIRPDAVMYTIPASILLVWHWARTLGGWRTLQRRATWGAAGIVLGLLPSMAFYGIATGNPFVPTQAVELNRIFSRFAPRIVQTAVAAPAPAPSDETTAGRIGFPSPGWHGGTISQVQGGGLRIAHLRTTLRGNWGKIRYGYGRVLVVVGLWGVAVGLVLRPMFTAAALAYVATAILFFSMWTRPDSRYLIGVWVILPMFIVEGFAGTLDLVRWLWRRQRHEVARGTALAAAIGLLVAYAFLGPASNEWREGSPMPTLTSALVAWGTLAALAAAMWPGRRIGVMLLPLLMVATTALAGLQAQERLGQRASFQRPQSQRARLAFRQAVPANGVVITSEDVGRPMENIEYYADRRALYVTDLDRWKIPIERLVRQLHMYDHVPYLLLDKRKLEPMVTRLRRADVVPVLVADIPPGRNYDFFVAAPFHRGLPMQLWRLDWPLGDVVKRHRTRRAAEATPSDRTP